MMVKGKWVVLVFLVVSWSLAGCGGGNGEVSGDAGALDQAGTKDASGQPEEDTTSPVDQPDPAHDAAWVVPSDRKIDYLILSAGEMLPVAEGFRDYRTTTGYQVHLALLGDVLGRSWSGDDVAEITRWVKTFFNARDKSRPFYLLIVGDADNGDNDPAKTVPAGFWPGEWESCDSDNFYGDMDGDHVPDLAIGRLPIRFTADGTRLLDAVKDHETNYKPGPWNHRLNVYAGEGGFGEDVDFFIETVAQQGLESVPYEYDVRFSYRSKTSSYYYLPYEDKVHDMVTEGALLSTYMGHGGGELDVPDLDQVICEDRYPMYTFFACSTGEFVGLWDSDSEAVMRLDHGPMAILVSTGTTHPYSNAINALEIEAAIFEDRPQTFGEAIRLMKHRSMYNTSDLRDMIDGFAETQIPRSEMDGANIDHMYSYNLLGDPAVQLQFPRGSVSLTPGDAFQGQTLAFQGQVDNLQEGSVEVKLVAKRGTILKPLADPGDPMDEAVVQANWELANNVVVDQVTLEVQGGEFSGQLEIPETLAKGDYHLAAYASDETSDAVGSAPVRVKTPVD